MLSFRIQISLLCSECPVPCPPPSELSSHALCVSSRSSPFAVSHHQHHRHHPHHHHHHSTCNSDFSTSICPVPNGAMKVTGSSIHRYRKSDFGVCANTDRVFFCPRTMRVSDNIPPNGSLNRLSDDQPWQSWGALFSDPDISVMNVQFHARPRFMNHPSWSHITTTIRVITSDTTTFRVTPSQVSLHYILIIFHDISHSTSMSNIFP